MKLYLADMLAAQERRKHISFHTPGHKKRGADITELSYSDNLSAPTGVIGQAQADIAHILGADASFLLTDGSTSGVYAMLMALRDAGVRKLAVPVCSHVSVLRGSSLMGLELIPVAQEFSGGIARQPTVEAVRHAMETADALILTSPDYYGFFPDLGAIAELMQAQNKPLVIDGAHGSHLHGTALHASNYASMWVDGVHKSLPAMTQGAVVSAKGIWTDLLAESVPCFRTTSPSYPILASIEYAVKYPRNERIERAAEGVKRALGALENPDWSKIVIPFGKKSGDARRFLESRGVYPEFDDGNYLMFYLSPATRRRELNKLVHLVKRLPRGEVASDARMRGRTGKTTVALLPQEAVGRVCAQTCGLFPPCMPVLLPGDVVSGDAARRLSGAVSAFGLSDGKIIVFED
mgnify:FL=1